MRKKWIILLMALFLPIFIFSANKAANNYENLSRGYPGSFDDEPDWVQNIPQSSDYYYFVGMGTAENRVKAIKRAKQDALGGIVLRINATISKKKYLF